MSDIDHNRMIPLHVADRAVAACEKEIQRLQTENAHLKAEFERSTAQYNGIIDTQLKAIDNLKAEVERLEANTDKLCKHGDLEIARLKAEVERLRASSFVTAVPVEEYEKLQAEVERLRKAGDAVVAEAYAMANKSDWPYTFDILAEEWQAAKEGKQP